MQPKQEVRPLLYTAELKMVELESCLRDFRRVLPTDVLEVFDFGEIYDACSIYMRHEVMLSSDYVGTVKFELTAKVLTSNGDPIIPDSLLVYIMVVGKPLSKEVVFHRVKK